MQLVEAAAVEIVVYEVQEADENGSGEQEEKEQRVEVVKPVVEEEVSVGEGGSSVAEEDSMKPESRNRYVVIESLNRSIDKVCRHSRRRRIWNVRSHRQNNQTQ